MIYRPTTVKLGSPEQIAGWLSISHETIYRYIYRDKKANGCLHLRCQTIPQALHRQQQGQTRPNPKPKAY